MDYSPKLPEHNVNVSQGHPLAEFFPLLVATIVIFLVVVGLAGLLVDQAVTYIDPELESELFASSPAQYDFEVEASSSEPLSCRASPMNFVSAWRCPTPLRWR